MKTTKKDRIERRRHAHWEALEVLAGRNCPFEGLQIWCKLHRIEATLSRACLAYSNDSSYGIDRWEADKAKARLELAKAFGGAIPDGVFINSDPRGYALKLDNEKVTIPKGMHTDMGGYGILAAEIND